MSQIDKIDKIICNKRDYKNLKNLNIEIWILKMMIILSEKFFLICN